MTLNYPNTGYTNNAAYSQRMQLLVETKQGFLRLNINAANLHMFNKHVHYKGLAGKGSFAYKAKQNN